MKRLPFLLVTTLCLMTVSSVRADAPSDQYQGFDSTNATITDNYTTLTWTRTPPTMPSQFLFAGTMCKSGSRLPTLKELLTIVDEAPHNYESTMGSNPNRYIDGYAFPNTADKPFWTATISKRTGGVNTSAFAVDFGTGDVLELDATGSGPKAYVRCVQ